MSSEVREPSRTVLGDISFVAPDIPESGGWRGAPETTVAWGRIRTDYLVSVSTGDPEGDEGPFIAVDRRRYVPGRELEYDRHQLADADQAAALFGRTTYHGPSLIEACGLRVWVYVGAGGTGAAVSVPEESGTAAAVVVDVLYSGEFVHAAMASELFAKVLNSVIGPAGQWISTCDGADVLQQQILNVFNSYGAMLEPDVGPRMRGEIEGVEVADLDGLLSRAPFVSVIVPVPVEDIEDGFFPADYPGFADSFWEADIELESGRIQDWPGYERAVQVQLKLIDGGRYMLLDDALKPVAQMSGHVPNHLLPGSFGEYLTLNVAPDGLVTNWLSSPNLDDYEPDALSHLEYQLLGIVDG